MSRFAFAALALAAMASGHLTITSPKPFEGSAKDPLSAAGDNFPCQYGSFVTDFPTSGGTPMKAGSSQKLIFDAGNGANYAVHGGGSCQISITYETDIQKLKDPASWRVIKSIEEGCPTNTHMNLDEQYDGPQGTYSGAFQCSDPKTNGVDCINAFDYDLPKDLPTGHATIAWTWFNNVGNREMYMNCAAAEIQGGSSSSDYLNSLPEMFVANLAGINQCASTESVSVQFPNPGAQLEVKRPTPKGGFSASFADYPKKLPSGQGCAANSGGSAPPPPQPNPGKPNAPASGPSNPKPKPSTSFTTQVSTVTASPHPSPSAGHGGGNSGGSSGGSSGTDGSCQNPCDTEGAIICLSNNQWGECAHGCAIAQPMAAGMKCSNGAMEAIVVGKRHPHGMAHRVKGRLI